MSSSYKISKPRSKKNFRYLKKSNKWSRQILEKEAWCQKVLLQRMRTQVYLVIKFLMVIPENFQDDVFWWIFISSCFISSNQCPFLRHTTLNCQSVVQGFSRVTPININKSRAAKSTRCALKIYPTVYIPGCWKD